MGRIWQRPKFWVKCRFYFFAVIFFVSILAFQNCGNVKFSGSVSDSKVKPLTACDDSLKPVDSEKISCPSGSLGEGTQTRSVFCTSDGTWTTTSWSVPPDYSACTCPISGQTFDLTTNTCNCPSGLVVSGNSCVTATCNTSGYPKTPTKACPSIGTVNGYQTATCSGTTTVPGTIQWDYSQCSCVVGSGKSAHPDTGICSCPVGQVDVQGVCKNSCPSGEYLDANGVCRAYPCTTYVNATPTVITSPINLNIPARSAAGVCYYMKLFDPIANASSSGVRLSTLGVNILSRDHDNYNNKSPISPYVLGAKFLNITLGGVRAIKLSGANNINTPILVDNYILVDLPSGAKVYGTSDSAVYGPGPQYAATNHVLYNNNPITVNSGGFTGGTATVAPLDISAGFPIAQSTAFNLYALDCGGSKELSPIYILFQ